MRSYLFIIAIFITILSCRVDNREENFRSFMQIPNELDTAFLQNTILDSIKLCYTTLTDLKIQGASLSVLKYDELDSLIKEYKREG